MTDARAWLDAHQGGAPDALRAAMHRALSAIPPESGQTIAERLAAAGLAALRQVVEGAGDRPSATELLAADALLTAACEAAAEEGPAALEALTARLAPGGFGALAQEPGS